MTDLKSSTAIWIKGILFLVLGFLSVTVILLRNPSLATATLLALSIWAFCRFYYFAFYVIEHYVDGDFKFDGLLSFVRYAIKKRGKQNPDVDSR